MYKIFRSGVTAQFEGNAIDDEPADRYQEFIATEEGTVARGSGNRISIYHTIEPVQSSTHIYFNFRRELVFWYNLLPSMH